MEKGKVGTYSFVAEPFHVDFTGHLTMGVLGNHLLNCAGFHAAERGFGMATLNENHYTWVLSRLAVEMETMPYQYEPFCIDTWVENVYRLFTDRNFAIRQGDRTIGYARSIWAMISMESRKPADLMQLHGGSIEEYVTQERDCPIAKPDRIKVASREPVAVIEPRYSDIDVNGHVNSIKYIEHIMDQFTLDYLRDHRVRRFEMAYSAESYYGDKLSVYRDETAPGIYGLELQKNVDGSGRGEVCVKSKIIFEKSNV